MYKKNFNEFLNLRYNQVISQVQTGDTYEHQQQTNPDNYFDDARYILFISIKKSNLTY